MKLEIIIESGMFDHWQSLLQNERNVPLNVSYKSTNQHKDWPSDTLERFSHSDGVPPKGGRLREKVYIQQLTVVQLIR